MYGEAFRIGRVYFERLGKDIEITIIDGYKTLSARISEYEFEDLLSALCKLGVAERFTSKSTACLDEAKQYETLEQEEKEYAEKECETEKCKKYHLEKAEMYRKLKEKCEFLSSRYRAIYDNLIAIEAMLIDIANTKRQQ